MKKFFTLLAVMFIALNINASKMLENVTWNAWGETTLVDGNNLTFTKAWAGAGHMVSTNVDETFVGADWSGYDYLVYEVSNVSGDFSLCVQYTADNDPSSYGSIGANGYGAVELNGDYIDQVAQTWIQCKDVGSITVDNLILMTTDEYAAYKESKKPQSDKINLWSGEQIFDANWPYISLSASKFQDAEVGDIIVVTISSINQSISPDWEWGSLIFFNDGSWSALPDATAMKVEGITETGEVMITLNEANLAVAKEKGLILQGMNVIVKSIDLLKGDPLETVIWFGNKSFDTSWPHIALPASKFADLTVGDKIIVTVTPDETLNPDWGYGPQIFFKKGDWSGDPDDAMSTSVSADGDYTFILTEANLATAKSVGLILQGMNVVVTKIVLRLKESITVNANSDKGTTTLFFNYPVAIAEGTTAWYASAYDSEKDYVTMTQLTDYIPANTGVVIKGTAGESYTFVETSETVNPVSGNLFKGQVTAYSEETFTTNDGWYYLALSGNFKKYEGTATKKVYKAYLYLTERPYSSEGKELTIDWGEATGIDTIQSVEFGVQNDMYNLSGVRVNGDYKGVIIMNGKKYINK